jgi:chromatin remodeling complex protein RSC6
LEDEDSVDYSGEKAFFSETIKACLEERLQQENNCEEKSQNFTEVDEAADFKIALELQQEEEKSQKIGLRRRSAGINRKYQERLVIAPSKNKRVDGGDDSNTKPKRVLNKPSLLSPEMAAVFDNQYTELPRPEVVKKLWEYIKAHNLQDPKDKRFILCDEKLKNVFNRPRVNCFKMAKYMSAHIHKKEDLSDSVSVSSAVSSKATIRSPKKSGSSPKKQKISNETVEDSDEEANEFLNEELSEEKPQMNPLLLKVPGVSPDMSYTSVQAAILAYTQVKKLRHPKDNDLIIVRANAPIAAIMGKQSEGSVHLLDLIQRVHFLFDRKDEK